MNLTRQFDMDALEWCDRYLIMCRLFLIYNECCVCLIIWDKPHLKLIKFIIFTKKLFSYFQWNPSNGFPSSSFFDVGWTSFRSNSQRFGTIQLSFWNNLGFLHYVSARGRAWHTIVIQPPPLPARLLCQKFSSFNFCFFNFGPTFCAAQI